MIGIVQCFDSSFLFDTPLLGCMSYRKDFYVNMQEEFEFFNNKNSSIFKNGCFRLITAIILWTNLFLTAFNTLILFLPSL